MIDRVHARVFLRKKIECIMKFLKSEMSKVIQ